MRIKGGNFVCIGIKCSEQLIWISYLSISIPSELYVKEAFLTRIAVITVMPICLR